MKGHGSSGQAKPSWTDQTKATRDLLHTEFPCSDTVGKKRVGCSEGMRLKSEKSQKQFHVTATGILNLFDAFNCLRDEDIICHRILTLICAHWSVVKYRCVILRLHLDYSTLRCAVEIRLCQLHQKILSDKTELRFTRNHERHKIPKRQRTEGSAGAYLDE